MIYFIIYIMGLSGSNALQTNSARWWSWWGAREEGRT